MTKDELYERRELAFEMMNQLKKTIRATEKQLMQHKIMLDSMTDSHRQTVRLIEQLDKNEK